jgi:class 3 adenylate cyclase
MRPPRGNVTFLFTDIERSSQLWEMHPQSMGRALAQHDDLVRTAVLGHKGYIFKTAGDAFCVAFAGAMNAVRAAADAQHALAAAAWEDTGPLRVRIALHSGEAEQRDGDYFGQTLNRVARVLSAGARRDRRCFLGSRQSGCARNSRAAFPCAISANAA